MVKTVLFHLGDPKTGSTSIQQVLAAGAFRSTGPSLVYPTQTYDNHIDLARTLTSEPEAMEARWSGLARALERSEADLAVVSAENFSHVDPRALEAAIRRYLPAHRDGLRLIAYVRPHAERLVSAFAERRKVGLFDGPMEGLFEILRAEGTLDYTPRFSAWRAVFGAAFTLRPMIRAELAQEDVVADFLDWALGAGQAEVLDGRPRNAALSCAELAAMVELHRQMRDFDDLGGPDLRGQRQSFGVNFGQLLAEMDGREIDRPRLHRSLAETVAETCRADAEALDAAFFEGAPMARALQAAVDTALPEPQPIDFRDYFGPEARHLLAATGTLLRNMLAADPQLFRTVMRGQVAAHPEEIAQHKRARHAAERPSGLLPGAAAPDTAPDTATPAKAAAGGSLPIPGRRRIKRLLRRFGAHRAPMVDLDALRAARAEGPLDDTPLGPGLGFRLDPAGGAEGHWSSPPGRIVELSVRVPEGARPRWLGLHLELGALADLSGTDWLGFALRGAADRPVALRPCLRSGRVQGFTDLFFAAPVLLSPGARDHHDLIAPARCPDLPPRAPWRELVLFLPPAESFEMVIEDLRLIRA